jgi:hypothetical protein
MKTEIEMGQNEVTLRHTKDDGSVSLNWVKFCPNSKGILPSIERVVKVSDKNEIYDSAS